MTAPDRPLRHTCALCETPVTPTGSGSLTWHDCPTDPMRRAVREMAGKKEARR